MLKFVPRLLAFCLAAQLDAQHTRPYDVVGE